MSITYYACSDLKRLSEPGPHRPQELEEHRNILLRAFIKDGFCIAAFAHDVIALPDELEPRLRELRRQRHPRLPGMGVLRALL